MSKTAEMVERTITSPKENDPIRRLAPDLKEYIEERLVSLSSKQRAAAEGAICDELNKGGVEMTEGWHARITDAVESVVGTL